MKSAANPLSVAELHPVAHYRDIDTVLRNADIAVAAGCAGVFLIHMDGLDNLLDAAVVSIRSRFPGLSIGVNRLASDPVTSIGRNVGIGADSTWCDRCGVTSDGVDRTGIEIRACLQHHAGHRFFGSVAFKYQRPEPDPLRAAKLALEAGFIPTTSGAATGFAPSIEKIAGMARASDRKFLAVASGITPVNVEPFLPYARYFLVSTGISRTFHEFDEVRVRALAATIAQRQAREPSERAG